MADHEHERAEVAWLRNAPPAPPARLVGRDALLRRLTQGLQTVPVGILHGLPGMGKTALAAAFSGGWTGRVVYVRAGAASLSGLLDDVRRQLARGAVPELGSDDARLGDALRRLEEQAGLWFLDDLHQLAEARQRWLVNGAGSLLRRGRFVATSQHRLAVQPEDPDRLGLTVEPLVTEDCRTLWSRLNDLQGPVSGCEAACRRAGGSPFLLRQAHAGGGVITGSPDPVAATLARLTPEERHLARALALARNHLPEEILLALLPRPVAEAALRTLFRRLIVERDGAGLCALHDLFRERLRAALPPEAEVELHAGLARALAGAALPVVLQSREVGYHLLRAGEPGQAGAYLVSQARDLVRGGAASELLEGLSLVPLPRRTPEMELLRGRCLVRLNEIDLGYEVLASLLEASRSPPAAHALAFAQAALLAGRLGRAEEALGTVLGSARSSEDSVLRARIMLANLRAIQGQEEEARQILEQAEAEAIQPVDRVKLERVRGFTYWIAGRYEEAEQSIRRARRLRLPDPAPRSSWRMYITFAAVYTNLGRLEEASEALREAGAGLEEDEENVPLSLHVERGVLLSAQGHFFAAARLLGRALDRQTAGGLHLGAWWVGAALGRNLLLLGRVREGLEALDAAEQGATAAGALAVARAARSERAVEPCRLLEDAEQWADSPLPGIRGRAGLLMALRAAARGDGERAIRAFRRHPDAHTDEPLGGLDAVLGLLTEAITARLSGDAGAFQRLVNRARALATEHHVDGDLVDRLLEHLGPLRAVSGDGASRLVGAAAGRQERPGLVLDGAAQELRFSGRTIALRTRPVTRELLYALARAPGDRVPNEALVRAMWGAEYNPLTHDTALRVNVSRLRALLSGYPMEILRDEAGYRLTVPVDFLFLEPFL